MKFSDLVKMGLRNLFRRKARTALTVIGMVIGTISIVIMFSIGYGMRDSFIEQVMENGSMTVITVDTYAVHYDDEGNYIDSGTQTLNAELVDSIKGIEHVASVGGMIIKSVQLNCGKYSAYMQVYAMDSTTYESFGFPALIQGEYPTPEKNDIIVFGNQAKTDQFYNWEARTNNSKTVDWDRDTITFTFSDYTVNENKKAFSQVIKSYAVMEESENWMYNYNVWMDLNYFKEMYTKYANTLKLEDRKKAIASLNEYNQIQVNVDNMENVTAVQDAIKELGYESSSDMQYIEPMLQTAKMLQIVLGAIGGVAMLVSAINIANTMIMSIYERTKEIGIMKVLGCMLKDIRKLFLFEAALIGLIGGALGIMLSYLLSWLINKYGAPLFESLLETSYMYGNSSGGFSRIYIWMPFVAMGFAMLVGIVSGYLPANRATKISAIEAMRTEG